MATLAERNEARILKFLRYVNKTRAYSAANVLFPTQITDCVLKIYRVTTP
jgi:hypothetical protein